MNLPHQQSKFYLDNHFAWLPVVIWQDIATFYALERYFTEHPFLCASHSEFANERNLHKTEKAAGMIQIPLFSRGGGSQTPGGQAQQHPSKPLRITQSCGRVRSGSFSEILENCYKSQASFIRTIHCDGAS